jgi:hypothetical protein
MATRALYILANLRRRLGYDVPIRDPYGQLNEVSMDILSRTDLMSTWKTGILKTVAPYGTGTASVNIGSVTVTIVAPGVVDAAMTGRKWRADTDTAYYRILTANPGPNTLTLETAYNGDVNLILGAYQIYQDEYTLASDFDGFVVNIRDMVLDQQLDSRNIVYGEAVYGLDTPMGTPSMYCFVTPDSTGNWRIRLQPQATDVRYYEYTYRRKRTILNAWNDELDIPSEHDDMVLAGMRARITSDPKDIADFETYIRRFKTDKDKDSAVRHIMSGMRSQYAAIPLPRPGSRYMTP